MLFSFFLKRFLINFFFFFVLITGILGAGNAFVRLPMIASWSSFGYVFFALIPLMAIFALPLAAGLAVHTTVGNLMIEDELLIIRFFSAAQRTLWAAVLVFSLIVASVYIPLTCYWAPQSYWAGKRVLLQLAKQQFHEFDAGKFHTPFTGATFFFKQKHLEKKIVHYDMIFLAFNGKRGERYFFTAQHGAMKNNCLYLSNGSIYTVTVGQHYFATFEQTEIHLSRLFDLEKELSQGKQAKFLSMNDLWATKDDQEAYYEFHKRIAQMIWLLLFPFLALMHVLVGAGRRSSWLRGVTFNGIVFLLSYVSLSFAHALWSHESLAFLLIYGIMGLVFGVVVYRFLKPQRVS